MRTMSSYGSSKLFKLNAEPNTDNITATVLSGDPAKRARAIVQAVTHYNNPSVLAEVSTDIGEAMVGISV